jgi:hypothetical protein
MDIIVVSTTLFLIITKPGITGASAGFILAFAGSFTSNVSCMMYDLRTFEMKGISLERTAKYRHLWLTTLPRLSSAIGRQKVV